MKEIYLKLLEEGWAFSDIENMDFFYYLDLLSYKENKNDNRTTIDQVF